LYAAGSLASTPGNIALFTETDGAIPVRFVSGGLAAGVTQVCDMNHRMFSVSAMPFADD
jgi:hypothetical protein